MCFCRKEHERCEFEVHEVYAIDVLISSGEGKVRFLKIYILIMVASASNDAIMPVSESFINVFIVTFCR